MPLLTQRVQLAAKIETVEGAAETLAAADVLLVGNPTFKPEIASTDRAQLSSSLSRFGAVPGLRSAAIEFDVELKGSGTAGTAPSVGKLMRACGFGETIVGGTSVTYLPASASVPSITMALYEDGMKKMIWGARGTFQIKCKAGEPCKIYFVFTGADFSVTDVALLSGVSYQTTVPQPFQAATFTIDAYVALIESLEINIGNQVALRPDVTSISGHKSAVIAKREAILTIDPEQIVVATYDFYGKWRSGAMGALSLSLGAVAGNIAGITAPKVQYTGITPGDRSGVRMLGIDSWLNRNSGDDEISIAFT